MDQFRPRFLGQVALAGRRSLGTKMMDPDASPEAQAGCTLLGFQRLEPSLTPDKDLQAKVDQAKALGLQIVEKSSSRPRSAFAQPGTIVTMDMVPVTEIWACPATYQSAAGPIQCKPGSTDCGPGAVQPTGQAPREGCTKIGVQTHWSLEMQLDLKAKVDQAKASGLEIVVIPTGRVFNEGSKSQSEEKVIWACPLPGQAAPPALPMAPAEKPDLVPVAAGAGVVAILAALIGGAFGK